MNKKYPYVKIQRQIDARPTILCKNCHFPMKKDALGEMPMDAINICENCGWSEWNGQWGDEEGNDVPKKERTDA